MTRDFDIQDLQSQESPHAQLAFVQIDHPELTPSIRAVSDVVDYEWQGVIWQGVPFGFRVLNDTEQAPEARLVVQNVDSKIGRAILKLRDRAVVSLWILSSADFDLSVDPREEIGDATPSYQFVQYDLVDVQINAQEISGRVTLRDFSQEPFTYLRATQDTFPGLFF